MVKRLKKGAGVSTLWWISVTQPRSSGSMKSADAVPVHMSPLGLFVNRPG
jgi:hypothetical protein